MMNMVQEVLDSPDFRSCPASSIRIRDGKKLKGHHCYVGGLLVHTAQMWQLASPQVAVLHDPRMELAVEMYLSVLFHDYPKILDYEVILCEGDDILEMKRRPESKLISHIYTAAKWFEQAISEYEPSYDTRPVVHNILAHHGRPEWGSAITPQTICARILHAVDDLSAKEFGYRETSTKQ